MVCDPRTEACTRTTPSQKGCQWAPSRALRAKSGEGPDSRTTGKVWLHAALLSAAEARQLSPSLL